MKPLALDLCCGKGGWTNGLLSAGWDVIGVDIEDMGGYQGKLLLADVCQVAENIEGFFPALKFDLVVASPPCQEFSVSSQPFKKSRAKFNLENPPDPSIWKACEKIGKFYNCPFILENVSGARKFMGQHTWKYGSWYFWGDLPALLPIGNPKKGFFRDKTKKNPTDMRGGYNGGGNQVKFKKFIGEYERNGFKGADADKARGHGEQRKQWSAKIAMIPIELSSWIGQIYKPIHEEAV